MKKILQCIFPKLFSKDLKVNNQKPLISDNDFKLELGKIQPVLMPDIMEQKKFEVVKWLVKVGDLVKKGQIVCILENQNLSVEFESFTEGKIVYTCEKHRFMDLGDVLFKIEGI